MTVSVEDVAILLSGRDLNSDECNSKGDGVPYLIGASNVNNGQITFVRWTTSPKVISKRNDILISCKGTIGEILINIIGDIHIARQFMVIRIFSKAVLTDYFLLAIKAVIEEIKNSARGIIPGVSRDDILFKKIGVPPLNEQVRIINEQQKLFNLIDLLDSSSIDIKDNLSHIKAKILEAAISGKLVPQDPADEPAEELLRRINPAAVPADKSHYQHLPKGWCESTLGKIGKWQSGGTPNKLNKEYYNGDIPWLLTADLNDGLIIEIPKAISELGLQNSSAKLNPKGSVLIAMYGATIGKLGILNSAATTNQACCACVEYKGLNQKYLFYFLLSKREYFKSIGGGGAQPNISKDKITKTPIPIPPYNEQCRIVEAIESINRRIDDIAEAL